MFVLKTQDQGLITLSQQDYLPIMVESFLIDRRSQGLSPDTIELYTKKLQYFQKYCERQALTQVSQITPDFIALTVRINAVQMELILVVLVAPLYKSAGSTGIHGTHIGRLWRLLGKTG